MNHTVCPFTDCPHDCRTLMAAARTGDAWAQSCEPELDFAPQTNVLCAWCFPGSQIVDGRPVSHGICGFHSWLVKAELAVKAVLAACNPQ